MILYVEKLRSGTGSTSASREAMTFASVVQILLLTACPASLSHPYGGRSIHHLLCDDIFPVPEVCEGYDWGVLRHNCRGGLRVPDRIYHGMQGTIVSYQWDLLIYSADFVYVHNRLTFT